MAGLRVLLVDADIDTAKMARVVLEQAGHAVVLGARDQQRLAGLDLSSALGVLTVPVGDGADCDAILDTFADAWGAPDALVVPVGSAGGRVEARVRPVAEAMAMAEGLAQAAEARALPVVVVGSGASAVIAFASEAADGPLQVVAVASPALLQLPIEAPTRRRDRLLLAARSVVHRVRRGADE